MAGWKKNILLAAVLTASTLAPMASAFMPEGTVNRVGAIYKNVRTIMNTPSVNRELEESSGLMTRCFTECIEQNLSPNECVAWIEAQLDAAGGHAVGDISIKVQVPRTPEVFAETYWMVEVPSNVNGQMTCDRNNGETYYPFLWDDAAGSPGSPVSNINCQGLSAGDCCVKIRAYGQTALGGKDANGYCLGCFAHLEPLIPVVNSALGTTEFQDYQYDATGGAGCTKIELMQGEVDAAMAVAQAKVDQAIAELTAFVEFLPESPSVCAGMVILLETLYDAATAIAPLSALIGEFSCNYCYGAADDGDLAVVTLETPIIANMLQLLEGGISSIGENCVIIYTNADGAIVDIPKLGGSRADDPYDEDCPDGPNGVEMTIPNCPPGSGTDAATGECSPCAAGAYGQGSVCLACPPGTISTSAGASVCDSCGDRAISTDSLTCQTCDIGTLQVGGTECVPCPAGTAQQITNECQPCYVGLYQPNIGQQFCPECPRTKIAATVGSIACETCPDGFAAPNRGMSTCDQCAEGELQDHRGRCKATR